jgi:hypothetical protein
VSACALCGKQIRLLSRLTDSQQFCSDDHRKQYQEQTNQLALTRLKGKKVRRQGGGNTKAAAASAPQASVSEAPDPMVGSYLPADVSPKAAPLLNRGGSSQPVWRKKTPLYPLIPLTTEADALFASGSIIAVPASSHTGGLGLSTAAGAQTVFINMASAMRDNMSQTGYHSSGGSDRFEEFEADPAEEEGDQTVSDFNQEPKQASRFKLAQRPEPTGPTFPMAGPFDCRDFLTPSDGNITIAPLSEGAHEFPFEIVMGSITNHGLETTGFEGLDELIAAHSQPVSEVPSEVPSEPEPAPPALRNRPIEMEFAAAPPASAKMLQGYPATPLTVSSELAAPRMSTPTLHMRFAKGKNPNAPVAAPQAKAPAPVPEKPAPSVQVRQVAPTPVVTRQVPATPITSRPVQSTPVTSAPAPTRTTPVQPPVPAQQPAAAKAEPVVSAPTPGRPQPTITPKPGVSPHVTVRPPSPPQTQKPAIAASTPAPAPIEAPVIEKPAAEKPVPEKPAPQKPVVVANTAIAPASPPANAPKAPAPAAVPEKPKINVRPAPQPAQPSDKKQQSRPAIAAREGSALPAERPSMERPSMDRPGMDRPERAAPEPPPSMKPKVTPIRQTPEPVAPAASTAHDVPMLGMPAVGEMSPIAGFWHQASTGVKGAFVAAAVLLAIGAGTFLFRSGSDANPALHATDSGSDTIEPTSPGMVIGGGGWNTTWGAEAGINKGKQISIFRPSMSMNDYRIEFRGQIEKGALGWIFRAKDPKNYYVEKLVAIKPGLNPVMALIKYSVIEGKEGTHTQVMLPGDFRLDTIYSVRCDIKGNKFTTHVQGKLADYWTDDQIKTGGAGFYSEPGERGQIQTSQIAYLR